MREISIKLSPKHTLVMEIQVHKKGPFHCQKGDDDIKYNLLTVNQNLIFSGTVSQVSDMTQGHLHLC